MGEAEVDLVGPAAGLGAGLREQRAKKARLLGRQLGQRGASGSVH